MESNYPNTVAPLPPSPPIWSGTIVGFVLSLLSLVCLGLLSGIPGLILGIVGLNKCKQDPTQFGGKGFAIAAIAIGAVGSFVSLIGVIFSIFVFATEGSSILPFIYAMF